jgi:hypothetical protein
MLLMRIWAATCEIRHKYMVWGLALRSANIFIIYDSAGLNKGILVCICLAPAPETCSFPGCMDLLIPVQYRDRKQTDIRFS